MEEITQSRTHTEDIRAAKIEPEPWVKPTIERIPLNEAMNGPSTPQANDGINGSIS